MTELTEKVFERVIETCKFNRYYKEPDIIVGSYKNSKDEEFEIVSSLERLEIYKDKEQVVSFSKSKVSEEYLKKVFEKLKSSIKK